MTGAAAETTPLISRANNSPSGPRRRIGPQHTDSSDTDEREQQQQRQEGGGTTSDKHNNTFSPSLNEFDKEDRRRNPMGRFIAFLERPFVAAIRRRRQQKLKEDSEYYEDSYNDLSWRCSFGTTEDDGIWLNTTDPTGAIMSLIVWILIIYAAITVALLGQQNHMPHWVAMGYGTVCALALASHAKTAFTDPGAIPLTAVPCVNEPPLATYVMCAHCQCYKPRYSHHCRICKRCISRMDHHCPWMNNCIGTGNLKHFILFLFYTWFGATFALVFFAQNYFFCATEACTFSAVLIQLVRVMTLICVATLLFTSSMLMNVMYGVITGIGTIDRLKTTTAQAFLDDDEPIPLQDIFGIQGFWSWFLPMDPVFPNYDRVLGFSTTQRLLREQQQQQQQGSSSGADSAGYSQV